MFKDDKSKSKNSSKIHREMKIGDYSNPQKDFKEVDEFLKTLTKNFMKDPSANLETLDKAYYEMVDKKKLEGHEKHKEKRKEEKAIFYDIFIKPKESKITEIRNKRMIEKKLKEETQKKKMDLNDNLVTKASNSKKVKTFFTNKMKGFLSKVKKVDKQHSNDNIFQMSTHLSDCEDPSHTLFHYLSYKFLPAHQIENKSNFFNQLIQIKPPEGINAVVASPLMECKF